MRNTGAFKEAVAETLAQLAHRGVTVRPGTVANTIERSIRAVATQLGIQERSTWRYFDPAGLPASIARQRQSAETSGTPGQLGRSRGPRWSGGERAEGARQTTPEGRQARRGVPDRPVPPTELPPLASCAPRPTGHRAVPDSAARRRFRQVAGPLATPETPGPWWSGLRLPALDGTQFDLPDATSSGDTFDGPSTTGGVPAGVVRTVAR
ncbi:hypothetical protein [Streptomyces sp. NRRL F-2664]|uniref:hypothetical protein n=1 Tax=Streptomyces sp. NRRL F-2664 TaxID=1463842 RepID=UPI0018FE2381|nr:hypothetical protein [Streptomyces sp. NRRL F-2664]